MNEPEKRVADLIRLAYKGVTLGNGVGLLQGQGIDDYADAGTLAAFRLKDEKMDWSQIPASALDDCYSSLSFFDAEGMRFHLPAFLIADLEGTLDTANVIFHLCSLDEFGRSKFSALNAMQRAAVREFLQLRFRPSNPDYDYSHPLIKKALAEYWTAAEPQE